MASVIRRPAYWLPIAAMVAISLNASLLAAYINPRTTTGVRASAERPEPTTAAATVVVIAPDPVPTSAPPPDYGAVLRDSKRHVDLVAIHDALQSHRAAHGAYPSTGGEAQTFCERDGDAGCVILAEAPGLSTEDSLSFNYWYVSDGREFTLYAPVETVATGCDTDGLPAWLASGTFYCVTSEGVAE